MSDLYRHSDRAIKAMHSEIEREFQNLSVVLRFDELNLLRTRTQVAAMYKRLDAICREQYESVAGNVREDVRKEVGVKGKSGSETSFVKAILTGFNLLTKYSYRNEWNRKRDRLVESLMSSENRLELRLALRRALDLLENQVRQYSDIMTDEARMDVFEEAGVEKVRWNTQHDGRVCGTCDGRDGQVYKLSEVPTKHYRCRCYLTAVK